MMKQKGSILIILLLLLAGAGLVFVGYKYVSKQNAQKTITPAPYPLETIDPTVNWKTYTDPKYNYSFKYPPQWDINQPPIGNSILVGRGPNEEQMSVGISSTKSDAMVRNCKQIQQVLLDNIAASRCEFTQEITTERGVVYDPPIIHKTVYIEALHNGLYYIISLGSDQASGKFEVFDQILSTLKFLNQKSNVEGQFCGGFAGVSCPQGYRCKLDGNYPDAGGTCTKK